MHFVPQYTWNVDNKRDSQYVLLNLNSLNKVIDANKIIELYCLYNDPTLTIKYGLNFIIFAT